MTRVPAGGEAGGTAAPTVVDSVVTRSLEIAEREQPRGSQREMWQSPPRQPTDARMVYLYPLSREARRGLIAPRRIVTG